MTSLKIPDDADPETVKALTRVASTALVADAIKWASFWAFLAVCVAVAC